MIATAPTLLTERLVLREPKRADFEDSLALWADPVVVRYISGRPSTREESWTRFLRNSGLWPALGFGFWTVEEKASGRFIGEIGFADFKREMTPSFDGAPEMGWVLATAAHGKGYATEAVRAAIAWGDKNLNGQRMVCMISPENRASLNVAAKCGFKEFARTIFRDHDVVLFERR